MEKGTAEEEKACGVVSGLGLGQEHPGPQEKRIEEGRGEEGRRRERSRMAWVLFSLFWSLWSSLPHNLSFLAQVLSSLCALMPYISHL